MIPGGLTSPACAESDYCVQTCSLSDSHFTWANVSIKKSVFRTDLLKCRYCSYETIQKSNLKLHEVTHERGEVGVAGGGERAGLQGD